MPAEVDRMLRKGMGLTWLARRIAFSGRLDLITSAP